MRIILFAASFLFVCASLLPQANSLQLANNEQQLEDNRITANNNNSNNNNTDATTVAPKQQLEGKILEPETREPQFGGQIVDGLKSIVDLSYPLENGTLHWPQNNGFQYVNITQGQRTNARNETYHYKSDSFITATHTGTHLDAPIHFSKSGWSVDKIPLERLVDVRFHVVDLSDKVKVIKNYSFTKEDFLDPATGKDIVTPKSVCLVYTGLSKEYSKGEEAYLGTNSKNISEMKIPGFSKEAAQYLVDREVYGVGLDAPSADSSDRHETDGHIDPVAHVILNSNQVYIIENISNKLGDLVKKDTQMRLTAIPLPIVGGSGSPVRLFALSAHDDCGHLRNSSNGQLSRLQNFASTLISSLFGCLLVSKVLARPQTTNY